MDGTAQVTEYIFTNSLLSSYSPQPLQFYELEEYLKRVFGADKEPVVEPAVTLRCVLGEVKEDSPAAKREEMQSGLGWKP